MGKEFYCADYDDTFSRLTALKESFNDLTAKAKQCKSILEAMPEPAEAIGKVHSTALETLAQVEDNICKEYPALLEQIDKLLKAHKDVLDTANARTGK